MTAAAAGAWWAAGAAWGWIPAVFATLAGLCIGSFLNVCIWRIPRGESIAWPGSHCPKCGHPLGFWDNLPLVSWAGLRGKCRYCREPISARYPLVEALTGALFLAIWLAHGAEARTGVYAAFAASLVAGAFIDIDHLILPDRITLGWMGLGVAASAVWPELQGQDIWWRGAVASLAGAALGFGLLWGVAAAGKAALKRDAMGMGDWKLLGAVGALLGWKAVLFTVLVSSLSGTLFGVAAILAGGREWRSRLPYGPHLAAGAVVWMIWGERMVDWYWAWATGA